MAESPKALPDVSGTPPPVRCEGEGLANAIVRQANSFQIIVPEHETNPKLKLEDLHVHIHGGGVKLRSKLVDNGDGSYTASYTPEVSGEYKIDVSLFKEPVAGSPFTLVTSTRTPHPPHCSIVGDALHKAVSRE